MRLFFIHLYLLVNLDCLIAQSLENYLLSVRHKLETIEIGKAVKLFFEDKCWDKETQLDLETLKNLWLSTEKDENLKNSDKFNNYVMPINVKCTIDYLNFYKGKTEITFAKGIISLTCFDMENPSIRGEYTVTADIAFENLNYSELLNKNDPFYRIISDSLSQILIDKILKKIEIFEQINNLGYRLIVSSGKAFVSDSLSTVKENAVMDALREACARAWGIKVENVSSMYNYGDVEDKTTSSTNGLIVVFEVLEEFTKVTTDNYYCVVVKSLLKKNYH